MKKLSFVIIFSIFILFNTYEIYSQQIIVEKSPTPTVVTETPSPTIEDYEKFMNKMGSMAKNLMVFDSWKEISFLHKETGEIVLWKDMSDYEKTIFCLLMAEKTTIYFTKMDSYWQNELKEFDKPEHKLIPTPNPVNEKQKPATKEDVKKYVSKLTDLRKKFALDYENFAEKSFKKYEKEMPKAEIEKILKSMRDYHDNNKLVERKKKTND